MLEKDVKIGKFTLESLTTGMYSDPLIVYREYIQNSVDSLEAAINTDLIEEQYIKIEIIIDDDENKISIQDNGVGISSDVAVSRLVSVGASTKSHSTNRGFRGIGRLGGLSYCSKLIFTTTAYDEEIETVVIFDCDKLKEMLVPGKYENLSMENVMSMVTSYHTNETKADSHYFRVELIDVVSIPSLMDIDIVQSYISQVAPVPYHKKSFIYSTYIKEKMSEFGVEIAEFPIYLGNSMNDIRPIYKPNKSRYLAGRSANQEHDEMLDVRFFYIENTNNETLCVGWHGISNWLGTITDQKIKGIRYRKGNIQIGDSRTLNSVFKQNRFNGWSQGEIFIVHNDIIPNARRDDFEQTDNYLLMTNMLTVIVGDHITRVVNIASRNRNNPNGKILIETEKSIKKIEKSVCNGYNSMAEKRDVLSAIEEKILTISSLNFKSAEEENKKQEVMKKLEETRAKILDDNNFKLIKVNSSIGKKEKKIINVISDILTKYVAKEILDKIIDEIINHLNNGTNQNENIS